MKTESCKLYARDFGIFLPNNIKIDRYNFELYRFKVGPFFETQCRIYSLTTFVLSLYCFIEYCTVALILLFLAIFCLLYEVLLPPK